VNERVPIEQIILNEGDPDRWSRSYLRYAHRAGDTFKEKLARHKERFGRQTKTVLGSEYCIWIWERKSYTIVLSKRGTEIDVHPFCGLAKAWDAWRQYLRDYGMQEEI
jgi:hypothetical protein